MAVGGRGAAEGARDAENCGGGEGRGVLSRDAEGDAEGDAEEDAEELVSPPRRRLVTGRA
jgi:hypothetical protein